MFQSIWVYHITYPSQYCSIHALDLGLIYKEYKNFRTMVKETMT